VIAGDIDPDEAIKLATSIYGVIEPFPDAPRRFRPQEPASHASRLITLKDDKVEQPMVYRLYATASEKVGDTAQVRALEVLSKILGEGNTSRLYKSLVMEQGLAASAGSFYHPMRLDQGLFGVYAYPKEGVSLDVLDAAMEAVLQNLIHEGVRDDELQRAKTLLIAKTTYKQDSQYALAYHYGQALTIGIDIHALVHWPDQITQVSVSDVANAARDALIATNSATGYLLPESLS
jgi:zinc protease